MHTNSFPKALLHYRTIQMEKKKTLNNPQSDGLEKSSMCSKQVTI